jgi:hypothetical protein
MTSYTVCARTGCNNRVSYDKKKDTVRHRYCKACENEIGDRLVRSQQCSDADLVTALMIKVVKE